MRRRFLILIAVLIMLSSLCMTANARELPNLDENGSLTITMDYNGQPLNGGEFTIYRVADIAYDDGDLVFRLIEEIDPNRGIETNFSSAHAMNLISQVRYKSTVDSYTAKIVDGKAEFPDVKPGLYAVIQYYSTPNFGKVSCFFISVPRYDGEHYISDVVADPKPPIASNPTDGTTGPTNPTNPPDEKLPQTGQLNWPVPVLAAGGLALFVFGWWMRFGKKKETYEE